jgi:hypothetical protein
VFWGGLNRYVVTGMRSTKEARIGDTLFHSRTVVEPLPGHTFLLWTLSVLLYLLSGGVIILLFFLANLNLRGSVVLI